MTEPWWLSWLERHSFVLVILKVEGSNPGVSILFRVEKFKKNGKKVWTRMRMRSSFFFQNDQSRRPRRARFMCRRAFMKYSLSMRRVSVYACAGQNKASSEYAREIR